jgi:hypothetical protein
MRDDPLYPVLSAQNYEAVDRRLRYVIQVIHECLMKSDSVHDVLRDRFDDNYHASSHSNTHTHSSADGVLNASCLID